MYKLARPFFLKVITPLHAGSGSQLGTVDLPIQRERHTDYPKIEGSGLKGSIREVFEEKYKNQTGMKQAIDLAFGPEDGNLHAGALGFTDVRLLLFPVKSMKGVFAWITCPAVLERLRLDLELCGKTIALKADLTKLNTLPSNNDLKPIESAKGTIGQCLTVSGKLVINETHVILEEYAFQIIKDKNKDISQLATLLTVLTGVNEVKEKLVILYDDDFRDFTNLSTEVITRIKINNDTGTVQTGGLFTEEYLPVETILYSLALATPVFSDKKGPFAEDNNHKEEAKVMQFFANGLPGVMQIGGNATIGKGIVLTNVAEVNHGQQ